MSELLWVAVPGGMQSSGRLLRVLVVPKLDAGTVEAGGMATWPPPGLSPATTLLVVWRIAEGSPEFQTEVSGDDIRIEAQAGLWSRFFNPAMVVDGERRRGATVTTVDIRPTTELAGLVDGSLAATTAVVIRADDADHGELDEKVLSALDDWADREPPAPSPAQPAPAPSLPPDFNRAVSFLREHPAVLRALGLIFDLRVTPPAGFPSEGELKVLWPNAPDVAPGIPKLVSPWTAFGRTFRPRSTADISAGMVTLTPDPADPRPGAGQWSVVKVDIDTAERRFRDAAASQGAGRDRRNAARGATAGAAPTMPAMRTAGLQLVRNGRAGDFAVRARIATENAGRTSLDSHVLDADDLVLGYRIDVKRGGGEWRSLHQRIVRYQVDGVNGASIGPPEGVREEGHIKALGAVREANGHVHADEVVARWSGWSLAVPRPRFDPAPGSLPPARKTGMPFDFDFSSEPEAGSLPSLRFAATYTMRARVVDMAGGSLSLDDPEAGRCEIGQIDFGRYEPVPSPGLVLDQGVEPGALGPAEAVDVVVVRSAPEVSVDDFASRNPAYQTHAGRRLLRPSASLLMAEYHKMLDQPGLSDEQTFAMMQRAFAAPSSEPHLEHADGPLPDPAAGGILAFPIREPAAPPAAVAPEDWEKATSWPELDAPKSIELRNRSDGQTPLRWEGDTLVVRLAPAEQLRLQVSSSLREDFLDHFALGLDMPDPSKAAAKGGRHPMITPAQIVTFVHAIRRPIVHDVAAPTLALQPRQSGQTFAQLDPVPARLGVDPNSTAQVDVVASWDDRRDDEPRSFDDVGVQTIAVQRGDEALRGPIRHEFGDTRHRVVTYTLTAVSRYRQFFKSSTDPVNPEDPGDFRAPVLTATVRVPNTALPNAPVVVSTRPAFVWTETADPGPPLTITRRRRGGHLRVELARPWFQTGDGERLAVIAPAIPAGGPAPEPLLPFISQVGRDPIWATTGPERWPRPEDFGGVAGAVEEVPLVENGAVVLAVPYEPWFHNDRWYADVALPGVAASSYSPFVQLVVARYQPESIEGHRLSTVVATEMVQLLPDRTLTVGRSSDGVVVSLAGVGPNGPMKNRVDVMLEHCDPPDGMAPEAIHLAASVPGSGGVPAWLPVPDATRSTTLDSEVRLPLPAAGGFFRVRIREVELIGSETGSPDPPPQVGGELAERTTYTDTVILPA